MTPDAVASHDVSVAVWDLPSPVVIGRRATLKVGVSCSCGCALTGATIEIRDEQGARVATGCIGSKPWPETLALYWIELDIAAPVTEGEHEWSFQATAAGPSHGQVTAVVRFVASRPPEHHVTLEVIQNGSGVPVAGVEVRLGRFRSATNDAGIAHVEVPGGTYDVCAWKIGYDLLSSTVHVAGDTTVHLEVAMTQESEQPYWM